uniref:Putative secreted protein n=1 Tax=Panstrongylus lignarius TaxID=156445 RepID=A0A224Y5I6_9HEMI
MPLRGLLLALVMYLGNKALAHKVSLISGFIITRLSVDKHHHRSWHASLSLSLFIKSFIVQNVEFIFN